MLCWALVLSAQFCRLMSFSWAPGDIPVFKHLHSAKGETEVLFKISTKQTSEQTSLQWSPCFSLLGWIYGSNSTCSKLRSWSITHKLLNASSFKNQVGGRIQATLPENHGLLQTLLHSASCSLCGNESTEPVFSSFFTNPSLLYVRTCLGGFHKFNGT